LSIHSTCTQLLNNLLLFLSCIAGGGCRCGALAAPAGGAPPFGGQAGASQEAFGRQASQAGGRGTGLTAGRTALLVAHLGLLAGGRMGRSLGILALGESGHAQEHGQQEVGVWVCFRDMCSVAKCSSVFCCFQAMCETAFVLLLEKVLETAYKRHQVPGQASTRPTGGWCVRVLRQGVVLLSEGFVLLLSCLEWAHVNSCAGSRCCCCCCRCCRCCALLFCVGHAAGLGFIKAQCVALSCCLRR
jgi:hypothetical protein